MFQSSLRFIIRTCAEGDINRTVLADQAANTQLPNPICAPADESLGGKDGARMRLPKSDGRGGQPCGSLLGIEWNGPAKPLSVKV